jgi:hypothetical protein
LKQLIECLFYSCLLCSLYSLDPPGGTAGAHRGRAVDSGYGYAEVDAEDDFGYARYDDINAVSSYDEATDDQTAQMADVHSAAVHSSHANAQPRRSAWGQLLGVFSRPDPVPSVQHATQQQQVSTRSAVSSLQPAAQPHRAISQQPDNAISLHPDNVISRYPDNVISLQPDNAVSVQPDNVISVQPDNAISLQPHANSSSSLPRASPGMQQRRRGPPTLYEQQQLLLFQQQPRANTSSSLQRAAQASSMQQEQILHQPNHTMQHVGPVSAGMLQQQQPHLPPTQTEQQQQQQPQQHREIT